MSLIYSQSVPSIAHGPPRSSADYDFDFDFETSALIAQFALEDIEQTLTARKGKSRVDAPLTDEEFAYQLQLESFQQLLAVSEDAKLAKSIGDAVSADAAYLEAFIATEEAAAADRRAAEMLSRGERLPTPSAAQARIEEPDFIMHPEPPSVHISAEDEAEDDEISDTESFVGTFDRLERSKELKELSKGKASDRKGKEIESRPNATAGPSVNRNRSIPCTICTDRVRYIKALRTPCDHFYCETCITSLVEYSTRDESLFPLKCCGLQPIPMADVTPFLPDALLKVYHQKEAEYSVPSNDRIYCANAICSTFLGSSTNYRQVDSVVCPTCTLCTCPRCKREAHEEDDCALNAATIELRVLAHKSGWKTCPGCSRLVEKTQGCNHITCRCATEFCYICALKWKTCECPQ